LTTFKKLSNLKPDDIPTNMGIQIYRIHMPFLK
jgi:hypothetical protein